ncbi:MAG TPA: universal stress protein [Usitatibacter sp.]|jgi:nucleotide-binding universal stress UspA family protein|nr:universal stress protein [Usitatibacter sp.]
MYRKILVPIDGSPPSAKGLREAIELAKNQKAKLRLVHVVDASVVIGVTEWPTQLQPLIDGLLDNGRHILERAARMVEKAGVKVESQLYESMSGPAAATILRDARKSGADLIVMGTHGRRGIRRLVMGSDAEHVLRESKVPLLLVRGR